MPNERQRVEKTLEIDGVSIGCFETGEGDPLIVFPAEDDRSPDPVIGKLAESYRIICFEVPHGRYRNPAGWADKLPAFLSSLQIGACSLIGISEGSRPAVAFTLAAPERIARLMLLSPLLTNGTESLDLAKIKTATLVLVGTGDAPAAIDSGRQCRESIPSCHLSFVYGAGQKLTRDRPQACLDPVIQFLEEGEQFIIFRESQVIRP